MAASLLLVACQRVDPVDSGPSAAADAEMAAPKGGPVVATTSSKVNFDQSIRPILEEKCTICHNSQVLTRRAYFETREGAMNSGMIIPGSPETSRMLTVVKEDPFADKAMPPVSHRLTAKQIATLDQWIEEGAHWPAGEAGRVKPAFIPEE